MLRGEFMPSEINSDTIIPNNLRKIREEKMMSTTELARKIGLCSRTIRRVEEGSPCRTTTKRKILEALGVDLADKDLVFPN
jgi:ribosome-binding protein aMBF1 (putative translation factor)